MNGHSTEKKEEENLSLDCGVGAFMYKIIKVISIKDLP